MLFLCFFSGSVRKNGQQFQLEEGAVVFNNTHTIYSAMGIIIVRAIAVLAKTNKVIDRPI
jgi:hypothetical protein